MKQFRLSRQPNLPGSVLTKFHVLDGASIIGSINVPNSDATALERHWLGGTTQPQASALATSTRRKENAMVAKMLEVGKRSNAPAPAEAVSGKRNPMIDAMLVAAPKNRLTRAAILRGC
jgi:hypothetical protein